MLYVIGHFQNQFSFSYERTPHQILINISRIKNFRLSLKDVTQNPTRTGITHDQGKPASLTCRLIDYR